MTVTKWERQNTFKSTCSWLSGSTAIDPSSNMCWLNVIDPDGNYLLQAESGMKESTGVYKYYISTASTDPLGLYLIRWYSHFDYDGRWEYQRKQNTEVINLCHVKQD